VAIFDHRLPPGEPFPERYAAQRRMLTNIVEQEISKLLPPAAVVGAPALSRSLLAVVHGHCVFALNGTFALLEESDPRGAAIARETLTALGAYVDRGGAVRDI
jgi:hypothetical protein